MYKIIAGVLLLLGGQSFDNGAFSQNTDTIETHAVQKPWIPVAMSMVVPGSGQIYNRSYWKSPFIMASFAAGVYSIMHYHSLYQDFKSAYDKKILSIESPLQYPDYYPDYSLADLKKYRDRYNLYTDISFISTVAVYLVNVVDAYAGTQQKHNPRAATIMSVILPGAGQTYNKKYWKVPVIYGGLASLYFLSEYNHKYYVKYRDMYNQKKASQTNPNIPDPAPQFSEEAIRLQREDWRRSRDLNYIGIGLLYILNVIDANVDANLIDYDVSDDLSMTILPEFMPAKVGKVENQSYIGAALTIKF